MSESLEQRLRNTLTRTAPLGPSDAAQISDIEVAASLFDPHNKSFNTLIRRDVSLLLGRRGSGKTALLNSYKYQPYLDRFDRPTLSDPRADFRAYDIVIDVATYKQFDEMQNLVIRNPGIFRPIEAIVDDWETLVMEYFFAKLLLDENAHKRETPQLAVLRRYLNQDEVDEYRQLVRRQVWGPSLLERFKAFLHHERPHPSDPIGTKEALQVAVDHLAGVNESAAIIFDSMDEYDIRNPTFTRSLGALIRFTSQFNASQDRIKIKLALPLEIFPEVQHASANSLKDLANVSQLKWTAIELAQIAAHRFQLFLRLHEPEQSLMLQGLDLNRREDVWRFWSHFLPDRHINQYGRVEDTMTYILRHTQLLPRQFLMILQKIIVFCAGPTNTYGLCSSEAVSDAIIAMEPLIANEILSAFSHIYPHAEAFCKPVFANFPTIFTFDELETKWRRKGRSLAHQRDPEFDMPHFGEMIVRMGIVGVCHEETERYYEGAFGYDALSPTNIGEGQRLCLHPIFSRYFNASGNPKSKAIRPRGAALR